MKKACANAFSYLLAGDSRKLVEIELCSVRADIGLQPANLIDDRSSRLQKSEKCNPCVRYELSPMSRAAHGSPPAEIRTSFAFIAALFARIGNVCDIPVVKSASSRGYLR